VVTALNCFNVLKPQSLLDRTRNVTKHIETDCVMFYTRDEQKPARESYAARRNIKIVEKIIEIVCVCVCRVRTHIGLYPEPADTNPHIYTSCL
jgi:hypothetical protein